MAEADRAGSEIAFLARLETETRLDGLLPHLDEESERRDRTLAAIRRLPTRRADAVRLIDGGTSLFGLFELHAFDLEPTPQLCRAYRRSLDGLVDTLAPGTAGSDRAPMELSQQISNLTWLRANGCDLSTPLGRAAMLLRQQDGDDGPALANSLDEVAGTPAAPPTTER